MAHIFKKIIFHAEMIQEVVRENALVWFSYQVVWQTEDRTC